MKLYLSGPMAGVAEHNFPAFAEATKLLRDAGFTVLSPAELGVNHTYSWEDYLRRDLIELLSCDGVAVLPGWRQSRGAALECYVAEALAMPISPVEAWLCQN